MSKFWIVLFHTYLSKIKTKSFIISTGIMLLLIIGLTNLSSIIDTFNKNENDTVAVLDETGELYQPFIAQVKAINQDLELKQAENEETARKWVNSEKIKGYLVLSFDSKGMPSGTYKANSISDTSLNSELSMALSQAKSGIVAEKLKLDAEGIAALNTPAAFENEALVANAKTAEELDSARGLVYVLLFVIYFGVLLYANMIAMEVATEKTSRVMEILISSVSPVKQMFAKIFGIALVSITQMLLFFGVGYIFIKRNLSEMNEGFFSVFGFESTSLSTIIYAIIFSLLGYLLYATLAACLGSMVSRIEDLQQMISPMTMVVVLGFMLAMFGLSNPEASFITVTSFIPFFAPMIMFLRVGMLEVPGWEVALSIGLLIATIVLLGIFGARIYRGGVLMYGKSNSFKDIKKALQITKNS
ncbi:hypothetical protein CVD28_11060 [Bacillus sp. M6-12]|uniref:ABC transporter permease n=1 Tax=Bacillus sp. M6-12 TaxID=2054166 RepID=UPI000C75B03C|nr:ABC transporter permease [Bacillus sp. M6-12]PLS17532.1 hypothetical protein CVD28_11060 [Bacillus sp. M6-12]